MKRLLIFFLSVIALTELFGQNYVDLAKVSYTHVPGVDIGESGASTDIDDWIVDLTYPIKLPNGNAIITGAEWSTSALRLFPGDASTTLASLRLKLGLKHTINNQWSGTYLVLPKLSARAGDLTGEAFQLGGIALFTREVSSSLKYKFGYYGTTEAFGPFMTPILGLYYLSQTSKFEANLALPLLADIYYHHSDRLASGLQFRAYVRSFILSAEDQYVHKNNQELNVFLQTYLFTKNLLIRAKAGYVLNDYSVYSQQEKIDVGVSAALFGDDRSPLNESPGNGYQVSIQLLYRYFLD